MRFIIAALVFGLIVFIHELGHFLLAKRNGVYVEEFSIGMGPTLVSFTKNETKYSLKLLPIGGSCAMLGEDESSSDERAFGNKSVGARISIIIAGPVFNFILAFLLSLFLVGVNGCAVPAIGEVLPASAAEEAGLMPGDTIHKMNKTRTDNFSEIVLYMTMHQESKPIKVTYTRDGKTATTVVTPVKTADNRYSIGIAQAPNVKGNPGQIIKYSAIEVKYWVKATVQSLGKLVTGNVKSDELSGPIGIFNMIGDTYTAAKPSGTMIMLAMLCNISILLSANLGVMNLLPIPALDGGRLLFLIIEAVRGKKMSADKEGMVHFIGFCALMLLMAFVFFNDIKNIFL